MGGKSTANTAQTTDQQDNRIAAAPDSVNLVASRSSIGGNVNIVSTDHDTVARSFDFARQISKDATATTSAAMHGIESVTTDALDSVKTAYQSAFDGFSDKVAGAYTEAKAGEQKVLVGGALLIGAIVAVSAMKKGS